MFKKIILGALLAGVIGVLVVGAVVRTNATSGEGAGGNGGRGRATEVAAAEANGQNGGGRWNETSTGANGRGGRWAQGSAVEQPLGGQGAGQGAPLADTAAEDWLTVTGTVVSATADLVEIETGAGEVIPLEGRPLSFALEQGFTPHEGDEVTLSGFEENGAFTIGKVSINGGAAVVLRDVSGRPGWAGRGRRG
jgi:RNase P/RNase MRP subunit p29